MFFFFNDTATTEIYTLSLHDALPIWLEEVQFGRRWRFTGSAAGVRFERVHRPSQRLGNVRHGAPAALPVKRQDRKSTRLNSSHQIISYAVFCLKKKK